MLLEIFEEWLRAAGVGKLFTAANGEGALATLKDTPVDAMVSDIIMPVMDGVTLVRRLAEMERPIPSIVFVSGFADVDPIEMYNLGVEALIPKPLTQKELIDVLRKILADRTTLWLTPMETPPRQSMIIGAPGNGEKLNRDRIRLGKGGFSAAYPDLLSLGKVNFRCSFSTNQSMQREMSGQGYVRWRSMTDKAVGVEFAYLDPACRSWVMDEIATTSPRSFIPCF